MLICSRVCSALHWDSARQSCPASEQGKTSATISNSLSEGNSECCMTVMAYVAVFTLKERVVTLRKGAKLTISGSNDQREALRGSRTDTLRRLGRSDRYFHAAQSRGGQDRVTSRLHKRTPSYRKVRSSADCRAHSGTLRDKCSKAAHRVARDFNPELMTDRTQRRRVGDRKRHKYLC